MSSLCPGASVGRNCDFSPMSDHWDELWERFGGDLGDTDSDEDQRSGDDSVGVDLVEAAVQQFKSRQPKPKGRPKKTSTTAPVDQEQPIQRAATTRPSIPISQSLSQTLLPGNLLETKRAVEPVLPQMTNHFQELAKLVLVDDLVVDQSLLEAMQHRLSERNVVSKTVAGSQVGLSLYKFEQMRLHLSMCILWSERLCRASLEHFLSSSLNSNVIMYVDGPHMHDEFAIRLGFDLPIPVPVGVLESAAGSDGRTAGVCKVLQTQSYYALLVQVGAHSLFFQGSQGTWLQVLDSTSGEVILKALKQSQFITTQSEAYPLKVRLACTDSHKATKKAEELFVDEQAGWMGLHLFCEAHFAAICLRHAFSLVLPATSGMVHVSLALRGSSGNIGVFRKCLAAILIQRLHVLHGKPTRPADRHREACLTLFGRDRPHWASRVAVLRCLVNGDWSNRNAVEHYTSAVDEPSREEIAAAMTQKLVWALIPTVPVIFKPKSWVDSDHAMCDLWLIHACHGLLAPAFALYCRVIASKTEPLEQVQPTSNPEGWVLKGKC